MSRMIGLLLPLLGYACTATVITAALGYGYLRQTGKLSDETMFRVVALVHGVDLQEVKKAIEDADDVEAPPEEVSFDEQQDHYQTASLQFDAKRKQLADSLAEFDFQMNQLTQENRKYEMLKRDVEGYLAEQAKLVTDASLQKVRAQLEVLVPKKQAKPLLMKMIQDDRLDEVILLLGMVNKRTQQEILRAFDTPPEDLEMLYRIWQKMLEDNPVKNEIESRIKAFKQLDQQEK